MHGENFNDHVVSSRTVGCCMPVLLHVTDVACVAVMVVPCPSGLVGAFTRAVCGFSVVASFPHTFGDLLVVVSGDLLVVVSDSGGECIGSRSRNGFKSKPSTNSVANSRFSKMFRS